VKSNTRQRTAEEDDEVGVVQRESFGRQVVPHSGHSEDSGEGADAQG
jgi:hypothetical protein